MCMKPHCEDSCCCLRHNLEQDIFYVLMISEQILGASCMMKAFHPMRSVTADFAIYLCLLPQNPEQQKAKSMVEDHN